MNTYPPIHIQTHINTGNVAETLALMLGLVFLDADKLSVYPLSTLQVSMRMGWWGVGYTDSVHAHADEHHTPH